MEKKEVETESASKKKTFILDTNILIKSPQSVLFGFDDNNLVITGTTLEELDGLKNVPGETGYSARVAIRELSKLGEKGNFRDGIRLDNGGTIKIITNNLKAEMPAGWSLEKPDNRIICCTKTLSEAQENVVLITNDVSMQIKANMMGVAVEDYKNEELSSDVKNFTGRREETVSDTLIDKIYKSKKISFQNKENPFVDNEYILFISEYSKKSALAYWKGGIAYLIDDSNLLENTEIKPRNVGQRFALHALLAPVDEIPLVILKGPAGTAKTFLSVAAGIEQTFDNKYLRTIVTRSNTLFDEELGFLPGDEESKMAPLMRPVFDNIESYLRKHSNTTSEKDDVRSEKEIKTTISEYIEEGIIKIESMAYMRGRSIANTYLIIDEAQNTTLNQILGIVTRAGNGCKVVLCGDPNQIDNPKLSKRNNGLVYASDKMKGSELCAQIEFTSNECVRSKLSLEAAKRLTQ